MSGRIRRQQIIADILQRQPVASQEELRDLLRERGIGVTQATLSRDLREIGAVKTLRGYQLPGDAAAAKANGVARSSGLARTLSGFVTAVDVAGNLVVLRTGPGHAQLVALEIDRAGLEGVVGCLAGDDTLFLAIAATSRARALGHDMRRLAGLAHPQGVEA